MQTTDLKPGQRFTKNGQTFTIQLISFTLPVIMVNNPPHDMCYGNYCWYPTREAAVADLLKGSE